MKQKPKTWTPAEYRILRRDYVRLPTDEIALQLGRSRHAVKTRAQLLGLRKGRKPWTAAEDALLLREYPNRSTPAIAKQLKRTVCMVYGRAFHFGLSKSAEYLASPAACRLRRGDNVGAAYRFPKGHAPSNKGLRRPGWSVGRMRETQFKKGERRGIAVTNWKPIGTTATDSDGYRRRKVAEGSVGRYGFGSKGWEFVHIRTWTDVNGPVPPGHAVIFRDRNRANVSIDNLELVSRAELMLRNTIHRLPPQLKEVIMLKGRVKRRIRKREREISDGSKQIVRSA